MTIETIFKENYTTLVLIARQYSPIYAEDIAIEVFTKFIPLYRTGDIRYSKAANWLARCTKRLAITYQRKQGAEYRKFHWFLIRNDCLEDYSDSLVMQVIAAVNTFPGRMGSILRMCFFEGKTSAEVAQELHCSVKNIHNLRLKALGKLYERFSTFAALE